MQTIPASEIKRRGLAALEDLLDRGPVHVIKDNRVACVVLSAAEYARLQARSAPAKRVDVWTVLLAAPSPRDGLRSREAIDAELDAERSGWDGR